MLPFITSRDEVPQGVPLDRSAEARVEVPLLDERPWRAQSRGPELLAVVAANPPGRNARQVCGAL